MIAYNCKFTGKSVKNKTIHLRSSAERKKNKHGEGG